MGNSESVDSDTNNEGGRDTTNKQENVQKVSKNASATDLGNIVDSDCRKMPRLSNQGDVERLINNNARLEDPGNLDFTTRRKKDGHSVPEDVRCNNGNSTTHCVSQAGTNLEHTASATVDQLHHFVLERYPEHTDQIVSLLLEVETKSLNALMKQPRTLLKEKVDEVAASLSAQKSEEGQKTPRVEAQRLDAGRREDLGEQLYEIIVKWYPEKAEKLVGMFLELDYEDLKGLASDTVLLKERVKEAVRVLSSQAGASQIKVLSDPVEKEVLGEQVYEMVEKLYPDNADKVTGMLLEMDVQDLLDLIEREEFLMEKAQQAYSALTGVAQEFSSKHQPSLDFEKKEKLGEELYKVVKSVHPDYADKITGMLMEMDCKYLGNLITNPGLLKERIEEAFVALQVTSGSSKSISQEQDEKQIIGEQLYETVENLQPKYADKITGMLLEMPAEDLKALMRNHKLLEEKILQSLEALTENGESICPEVDKKQSLGERLFNIIAQDYPDQADVITGMLLEMDSGCIVDLLQNPELLHEKVQIALHVLSQPQSASEIRLPINDPPNGQFTKEDIGEKLYFRVEQIHPENADRITGILLELGIQDLQNILENPKEIQEKIEQVVQVL